MPPSVGLEGRHNASRSGSQVQNSLQPQPFDRTISYESDSDVNSIVGSTSEFDMEVDEQLPTPNTSESSHNDVETTRPPSPTPSSYESQDSGGDVLKVCMSLIRKRKRDAGSNKAAAPKLTKVNGSSTMHAFTNTPTFLDNQVKRVNNFFGSRSQTSTVRPRVMDHPVGSASATKGEAEDTESNKKARNEKVISHPFLLSHVREKRSRSRSRRLNSRDVADRATASERTTGGLQPTQPSEATTTTADGRPGEPPEITDPIQRKTDSSADPPVNTSERRRVTFADLNAPRKNNLPVDSQLSLDANQAHYTRRESEQVIPLTNPNDRENSLLDPSAVNQRNVPGQANGIPRVLPPRSRKTIRRDHANIINGSKRSQLSATKMNSSNLVCKRPGIPIKPSRHESTHRRPQPSHLATSYRTPQPSALSQFRESHGSSCRGKRSEVAPEHVQATERRREETIPRPDRPSKCKEAGRGARLSGFAMPDLTRPATQLRDEDRQPRRGGVGENTSRAEACLQRAQEPRPSSTQASVHSRVAHNGNNTIPSRTPLHMAIDEQTQHEASLPEPRPPPSSGDVFATAKADMEAFNAQHKKDNTTILVEPSSADFVMLQHSQSRKTAIRNAKFRKRNSLSHENKQVRNRIQQIGREVKRDYSHLSPEAQAEISQTKIDAYLKKKKVTELNIHEGLLTEDLLESNSGGGFNGEEVDLDAGKTPASRALELTSTTVCYTVYITKPLGSGEDCENSLARTRVFGKLDDANHYAEQLLEASSSRSSGSSKDKARQVQSQIISYQDGLLLGCLKLGDGKTMHVMVRKDTVLTGNLDPNALRNKWVDDDVVKIYRARYDVVLINFVPKSWQRKKEDRERHPKLDRERREMGQEKERQPKTNAERDQAAAEEEDPRGLDGAKPRAALHVLATRGSHSQPDSVDAEDEDVEGLAGNDNDPEENTHEDNNDETSSQASDSTMCSSNPAPGPLPDYYTGRKLRDEDVDVVFVLVESYTDRRLANMAAFQLAETIWKPRTPNINAVGIYREELLPRLRQARETMDLDSDLALYTFKVADFTEHCGSVDHRPWGFKESRVEVHETELKGPRDFGIDFVMDAKDGLYRPTTTVESAAENVRPAGNQDENVIDLERRDDDDDDGEVAVQNDIDDDHGEDDDEDKDDEEDVSEED